MNEHQTYMQRCFQLALNGRGSVYPNPLVGAVIVHRGKIIGEGWHRKAGEPHAEVMAVQSVRDRSLLRESTLYVNLEPCSHHGRTPACSTMIVREGIPRVVVANRDPFPRVSGRGIRALEHGGVEVITGIAEKEGNELNRYFFLFHRQKRPYIILKWAQSADGFLAPHGGQHVAVSSVYSRLLVHRWRSEIRGILIGHRTLRADNPVLDARYWNDNAPVPIVLANRQPDFSAALFRRHKKVLILGQFRGQVPENISRFPVTHIDEMMQILYRHDIQSVLVEGGGEVLRFFIDNDLWDEARIFTSPVRFGRGVRAPVIGNYRWIKTQRIDSDKLDFLAHPQNDYIYDGRFL